MDKEKEMLLKYLDYLYKFREQESGCFYCGLKSCDVWSILFLIDCLFSSEQKEKFAWLYSNGEFSIAEYQKGCSGTFDFLDGMEMIWRHCITVEKVKEIILSL